MPISLSYPSEQTPNMVSTPSFWLKTKDSTGMPAKDGETYLINIDQAGYFRVNYDDNNWKALTNILKLDATDKISTINRAQLVDDVLHMAQTNRVKYEIALDLLRYLSIENEFIPWEAALRALTYVHHRLESTPEDLELFSKLIFEILGRRYADFGFESKPSDKHLDFLGRQSASQWMCKLDYEACISSAQDKFAEFLAGKEIDPQIKDIVYQTGMQ